MRKSFKHILLAGLTVASSAVAMNAQTPLESLNAYPYDIKVEKDGTNYNVTYRLNAPAESAKVVLLVKNVPVKEYTGTTIAEYTDDTKATVNNLNTVVVPEADIPKDEIVSFGVTVVGATVAEPTVSSKSYNFYHPAGVAVDNNTDSPNFGRVLVTEAMTAPATGYHSSGGNQGVYAFDATLTPIKNANGGYVFKGGQTYQGKFSNGSTTAYDPRKIRIADDGRVFLSGQNQNGVALWSINPLDLDADFTPVISGTSDESYNINDADGNFVAAPNVSFDVRGEDEDLTILALSSNVSGFSYSATGFRTDEYNLGEAETWTSAPSKAIEALTGKYSVTPLNTSVTYDEEGGIWFASSRATAKATEPTLVHINAEGVEDYKIEENGTLDVDFYGGAGIRFNQDFSLLAVGTSDKKITIFKVTKDTSGAPLLVKQYTFESTIGRNCNDLAFDSANNLYFVGNSGEFLKVAALPRESGEVTVAAPSMYDVEISSDDYPAVLYLIGLDNTWDPCEGRMLEKTGEGVYTTTVTGPCNFGIVSELDDDWDFVNANRWGFAMSEDNKAVTINETTSIVKDAGAIRVADAGDFTVTVDLKNLTVLVAGEVIKVYPEQLYAIGHFADETWEPSSTTHVANATAEGVYQIDNLEIVDGDGAGYGYFAFTATPSTIWDEVNATRYGPVVKDYELADNTPTEIGLNGDTSFKILAGKYNITVNLVDGTILAVSQGGDSVEKAAADAVKVVAGAGEIRVLGNVSNVSIYTTAGQAVVLNSNNNTFQVARGIYVVVADGKTTKVMVK